MKKIRFALRTRKNDLRNRFLAMASVLPSPNYQVLNFGIGEDKNIVDDRVFECINQNMRSDGAMAYSENICHEAISSFKTFALKNYGVELEDENMMLTMGIKPTLNYLAMLLVDAYTKVLVTTPGYNIFGRIAKLLNAKVYEYPLFNDKYEDLLDYIEKEKINPKVISLNYPNNPTGKSASNTFYKRLSEYAEKHNVILINDAAYIDYSYQTSPVSLLSQGFDNKIEIYTASKTFGLTGMRVGMICGDKRIIEKLNIIRDQFDSGQAKPFLQAYSYLLNKNDISYQKNKYYRRYNQFKNIAIKYDIIVNEIDSTFYAFFKIPEWMKKFGEDAMSIAKYLKSNYSVIFIPYSTSSGEYLRASMTFNDDEDLNLLDQRLEIMRDVGE